MLPNRESTFQNFRGTEIAASNAENLSAADCPHVPWYRSTYVLGLPYSKQVLDAPSAAFLVEPQQKSHHQKIQTNLTHICKFSMNR